MLRILPLSDIEANSNPFNADHFHTGQDVKSNGMVIYDSTKVDYIILVDTATGQRYKVNFNMNSDRAESNMDMLGAVNGCFTDNSSQGSGTLIP